MSLLDSCIAHSVCIARWPLSAVDFSVVGVVLAVSFKSGLGVGYKPILGNTVSACLQMAHKH